MKRLVSIILIMMCSLFVGGCYQDLEKNSLDEYDNLFDSNLTETDYLTGLYEDIINLKDILGLYLSTVIIEKINQ